jgi:hypothetical protein
MKGPFWRCRSDAALAAVEGNDSKGKGRGCWVLEPCTVSDTGQTSNCGGQLQVSCCCSIRAGVYDAQAKLRPRTQVYNQNAKQYNTLPHIQNKYKLMRFCIIPGACLLPVTFPDAWNELIMHSSQVCWADAISAYMLSP